MTLLQLKYAYECYRCASISSAADALITTVSNVSKNLKSLEDECSFQIFERSPHGLIPTERGKDFLNHVQVILNEYDAILHISENSSHSSLLFASLPVVCSFRAFSKLVASLPDDAAFAKYHSTSSQHAIARLKNHLCDAALVGVHAVDQHILPRYEAQGIRLEMVGSIYYAVYLSAKHPLVPEFSDADILSHLYSYSYVEYNDNILLNSSPIKPYVPDDRIIKVNDRDWRFTLLQETNSFSSGINAPFLAEKYPWMKVIPIPDAKIDLYLALRNDQEETTLISRLRSLLIEEIIRINEK